MCFLDERRTVCALIKNKVSIYPEIESKKKFKERYENFVFVLGGGSVVLFLDKKELSLKIFCADVEEYIMSDIVPRRNKVSKVKFDIKDFQFVCHEKINMEYAMFKANQKTVITFYLIIKRLQINNKLKIPKPIANLILKYALMFT